MNIFRLAGDICHVLSIIILILRIRLSRNAVGISLKTQELYLMVFCTRYLDLFTNFYGLYNSMMKVAYILSTSYIIYLVRFNEDYKKTYDTSLDSFRQVFAVVPCAVIALATNIYQGFNFVEVRPFYCIFLILFTNITISSYVTIPNILSFGKLHFLFIFYLLTSCSYYGTFRST